MKNLRLTILTCLLALSGCAYGSQAPIWRNNFNSETRITAEMVKKGVKHAKQLKISSQGRLLGFHHYMSENLIIEESEGYSIVKIKPELWVVIPAPYKHDDFHGGWLIYQGKNRGWKSFFPSIMSDDQVAQHAVNVLKNIRLSSAQNKFPHGTYATYCSPEGEKGGCCMALFSVNNKSYLKTIFPMIKEIDVPGLAEIVESQVCSLTSELHYKDQSGAHEVEDAVAQSDLELILEMIELKSTDTKFLQELITFAVRYRRSELVELALACGAKAEKKHLENAIKASSCDQEQDKIVTILLSTEMFLDMDLIKLALKNENQLMHRALIMWCFQHNQEKLLAQYPSKYKDLLDSCRYSLSLQEEEHKDDEYAAYEAHAQAQKQFDKACIQWIKGGNKPELSLFHQFIDAEKTVKLACFALQKKSKHVVKELLLDDRCRVWLADSDEFIEVVLNEDQELLKHIMRVHYDVHGATSYAKIQAMLRTWTLKQKINACILLITQFNEYAREWLAKSLRYLTDSQASSILEMIPQLKDDGEIMNAVQQSKLTQSMALLHISSSSEIRSPKSMDFTQEDGNATKLLEIKKRCAQIIALSPLLEKLYTRACTFDAQKVELELKVLSKNVSVMKIEDGRLEAELLLISLKIVLKNDDWKKEFYSSDDVFHIINQYGDNKEIKNLLINNVKNNKNNWLDEKISGKILTLLQPHKGVDQNKEPNKFVDKNVLNKTLKKVIGCGADVNSLMIASKNGHKDMVERHIAKGTNVNIAGKDGWTPLMLASYNGHKDIVKKLIAHGANVNVADNEGLTALMFASKKGHKNIIEELIAHGANVNVADNNGWTPLMFASYYGYKDVVELLLTNGADVNAVNKKNCTSLMLASTKDIVELLIAYGADIHVVNGKDCTALMSASITGNKEIVELLIAHNANVDTATRDGWTSLMIASQAGRKDIVELLITHGANINAANKDGWTSLMIASQTGHNDIVEFLIAHGAAGNNID